MDATNLSLQQAADDDRAQPGRRFHPSTWVFFAAVLVAVPVILHTNRSQWFFLDDWDFLAGRAIRSPHDLLRPHNEHWTTLPVVQYRVTFALFGIEHYWPYQLPVVTAHLVSAALLRVVMLRNGVGPWLATAGSVLLVYFGSGRADIATAFQITFTGALALGLCHLLLADHDGPVDRRDIVGLACGAGAIMCSGIGPVMVVAVALAVLIRRGLRPALLHAVPLGLIYLAWLAAFGGGTSGGGDVTARHTIEFWRWTVWDTFLGAGQWAPVAIGLLGLAAIGLGAGLRSRSCLRRHALPVALLAGAAVLIAMVAAGRSAAVPLGPGMTPGRYVYLVMALVLPSMTLGAAAVAGRWRWSAFPLTALILAGLPGNLGALTPSGQDLYLIGSPDQVRALAQAAEDLSPPASLPPDPVFLESVTAGWLVGVAKAGQLPGGGPLTPDLISQSRLQMSLEQVRTSPAGPCRTVEAGPLTLERGEQLRIRSDRVTVSGPAGSDIAGRATYYAAPIEALLGPSPSGLIYLRAARPVTVALFTNGSAQRCGS